MSIEFKEAGMSRTINNTSGRMLAPLPASQRNSATPHSSAPQSIEQAPRRNQSCRSGPMEALSTPTPRTITYASTSIGTPASHAHAEAVGAPLADGVT